MNVAIGRSANTHIKNDSTWHLGHSARSSLASTCLPCHCDNDASSVALEPE